MPSRGHPTVLEGLSEAPDYQKPLLLCPIPWPLHYSVEITVSNSMAFVLLGGKKDSDNVL